MDDTTVGATPLGYQYSGRQDSAWKSKRVPAVVSVLGVTGKIQVGAAPGDSAQVIVPTLGVPLAGGTAPNAPDVEVTDPLLGLASEQAARPMVATTAHTASVAARCGGLTGFPRERVVPLARVPGSSSRAWAVRGRVIEPAFPSGLPSCVGSAWPIGWQETPQVAVVDGLGWRASSRVAPCWL